MGKPIITWWRTPIADRQARGAAQSTSAKRRRAHGGLRLTLETLEIRSLLSVTPSLVKDINQRSGIVNANQLTDVGSTLFFTANGDGDGVELWKSDGTSSGTSLVSDANLQREVPIPPI